jgi:hypothetical protein
MFHFSLQAADVAEEILLQITKRGQNLPRFLLKLDVAQLLQLGNTLLG